MASRSNPKWVPGQAGRGAVRAPGQHTPGRADVRPGLPARRPARWSGRTARSPAWPRSGTSTSRGFELGTGYSELVDPVVQRERLVEQAQLAAAGDAEAMQLDEDFLRAMEYGMPPTGGMGMGIDRLLMALTGARGIRETILFPLVRPS